MQPILLQHHFWDSVIRSRLVEHPALPHLLQKSCKLWKQPLWLFSVLLKCMRIISHISPETKGKEDQTGGTPAGIDPYSNTTLQHQCQCSSLPLCHILYRWSLKGELLYTNILYKMVTVANFSFWVVSQTIRHKSLHSELTMIQCRIV